MLIKNINTGAESGAPEQTDENPFNKILHWNVGDIEHHMKYYGIEFTQEQKKEFLQNHSECHGCGCWFKDTEFSSFSLGSVFCKNCDK